MINPFATLRSSNNPAQDQVEQGPSFFAVARAENSSLQQEMQQHVVVAKRPSVRLNARHLCGLVALPNSGEENDAGGRLRPHLVSFPSPLL